jgi:phenylalanyl-tRNA synthetase beta chain
MLVIADRDRAVAVAGVMGGRASEVSSATRRIVLESAWFLPASVRATSRKLGLKTEASARFERGADLDAPLTAMSRALALLVEITAGAPVGGATDVQTRAVTPAPLTLGRDRLRRLLGVDVPEADVARILTALGFRPETTTSGWQTTVPSHRVDVARDADLVEEIGRHWGFDRVPATFPALKAAPEALSARVARGRLLRRLLCGAGYQEAVTFTFIEDAAATPYAAEPDRIAIQNPLSEKFAVLRPSITPGLVESLAYNLNRQATNVRLFEIGAIFGSARGEREALGWVLTGARGDHWSGNAGRVQFADTMGVAELVTRAFGMTVTVERADELDWLSRGQAARLLRNGVDVGWVGRLAAPRGISEEVFAGEIDLDALGGELAAPAAIEPLARFPSMVRDLSIVVDDGLPAAEVRGTIRTHASRELVAIEEFDRYQGKGVPEGRVSLSVRLTFRSPDRTLTDGEVQRDVDAIVAALETTHGATLRGK